MSESVIKRNNAFSVFENLAITSDLNINTSGPSLQVDRWDSETSNNPKTAGITGAGDGVAITLSFSNYGTQYAFGRADDNHLCVRKRENGTWGSWTEYKTDTIEYKALTTDGSIVLYRVGKLRMLHIYSSSLSLTKGQYNVVATLDARDRQIGSIPVYFPVLNNDASASSNPPIIFHIGYINKSTGNVEIWPYIDNLKNVRATVTYIAASS